MTKDEGSTNDQMTYYAGLSGVLLVFRHSFVVRQSSLVIFLDRLFPAPNRQIIFRIDCLTCFLEAAFFQDVGGSIGLRERVCADSLHVCVSRCEIDEGIRDFGCITTTLIWERNAVSNFGDAVGIGRTGKATHADKNIVGLVDNAETEPPRICFSRILDACLELG